MPKVKCYGDVTTGGGLRGTYSTLGLFSLLVLSSWTVYDYQFGHLPLPLSVEKAGSSGFSEDSAIEHIKYLISLGPHPVGSDKLDLAVEYVHKEAKRIKENAPRDANVQVDLFHADMGANNISGHFAGKTLLYFGLKHVVMKIAPKNLRDAGESSILVSGHIDTVFSTVGAGDDSSTVAVMLELARGISQQSGGFKNSVVFLFNTGEEEGLNGAHSFITQHPWSSTIQLAVDMEAMGVGGKSGIFQASDGWSLRNFASTAKYPFGQVTSQDLFSSGVINSDTDSQIYREVGGLSGLDFAFQDHSAVYHTKNDKFKLLKPGSLQHLGDNMLPFLLQAASSEDLPKIKQRRMQVGNDKDQTIFFDILGKYMIVYSQQFATKLHKIVMFQAAVILAVSLFMGGYPSLISFGISCLSIVLVWILSTGLAIAVAGALPLLSPFPIPYIANPWLVIGLFGAPALLGAFIGQHIGFLILKKYLQQVLSEKMTNYFGYTTEDTIEFESERWLFKAGLVQWLVILVLGTYFEVGSSYVALIWLVSPALSYGLLEAQFSSKQSPQQLSAGTPVLGSAIPVLLSSGVFIRLAETAIAYLVRLDQNPGSISDFFANLIVASLVSLVVNLMFIYLLPYVHQSGAKRPLMVLMGALFALSLASVSTGIVPTFTEDLARPLNVVHVEDFTGVAHGKSKVSYISIFSPMPGKLTKELANLGDEFSCGSDEAIDFVTFSAKYNCRSLIAGNGGWSESEAPVLRMTSNLMLEGTQEREVSFYSNNSTRWALKINKQEVRDFSVQAGSRVIIPRGDYDEVDGWHIIQFSGRQDSPKHFTIRLHMHNSTRVPLKPVREEDRQFLLKIRADLNIITPEVRRVLDKLPSWCSLYGKSTYPYTYSVLSALPVDPMRDPA